MRFLKVFTQKYKAPRNEAELLEAYRQSGELGFLGALYEPYMETVFGICYKYLKDESRAKDAVMQIFEKLVKDLRVHEVQHFSSWLHSVARNFCLMQLRSAQVFVSMDGSVEEAVELLAIVDTGEAEIFSQKQMQSLDKCLSILSSEQKLAVTLFYIESKCYREIASETGFGLEKVKSYIQNGKRNLKICMERNG
ncbi:RNA polymerase sigma factor [Dyadobacter crusticola]|uniref:RNA polymerase sigma factor n=1 Tax=Dyadobacter crusticola TaxID=292407 RepID=UPI0004E0FDED|nr:sigma-70 family RNA polymerase sigma factor [Dyadobacter crusticola]